MGVKSASKKSSSKDAKESSGCCGGGFYDRCVRPALAELLGTTLFVFLVVMTLTATGETKNLTIALGQGLGLAFLATAFGFISGGHLNSAVTLSAVLAGGLGVGLGVVYLIMQTIGGFAGAALAKAVLTDSEYAGISGGINQLSVPAVDGFVLEAILTFILALVFLVAALDYQAPGAGFAVGLVVLVGVIVGLDKTGASLNPSRTLGPLLLYKLDDGEYEWEDSWPYFAGTFGGAALAGLIYRFMLADRRHRRICVDPESCDDETELLCSK